MNDFKTVRAAIELIPGDLISIDNKHGVVFFTGVIQKETGALTIKYISDEGHVHKIHLGPLNPVELLTPPKRRDPYNI